jgi:hypothetical protein
VVAAFGNDLLSGTDAEDRYLSQTPCPNMRRESLNANDYSGPIATKRAHRRRCPRTSAAFRLESRLASQVRSPGRQAAYRKNH